MIIQGSPKNNGSEKLKTLYHCKVIHCTIEDINQQLPHYLVSMFELPNHCQGLEFILRRPTMSLT